MEDSAAELVRSAILGIVQGLTEFLPISSSAHLILFPRLFGWPDQGLAFDIAANTGTLLALVVYFRRDLLGIAVGGHRGSPGADGVPLFWWLVVATIPVGALGLLAGDWVEGSLRNPLVIAGTTIVFGVLLWVADGLTERRMTAGTTRSEETHTLTDALALGVAQALALIPGTSRSGVVITAGLFRGFDRETAARLAFLMAIPVGGLVAVYDLARLITDATEAWWPALVVGFVTSALSGYAVIALLLAWLQRRSLGVFVVYRLAMGLVLLVLFW